MKNLQTYLDNGDYTGLAEFLEQQPRYITAVTDYLANGTDTQRQTAAWSLHHAADQHQLNTIKIHENRNQILEALQDDNLEVRAGIAATIGTLAQPDRLPQLGRDATDQLVDQMTDAGIDDELYWSSYAVMRVADYAPREVAPHRDDIETMLRETDQELDDEDYVDVQGEEPPHVLPHLKQILENIDGQ